MPGALLERRASLASRPKQVPRYRVLINAETMSAYPAMASDLVRAEDKRTPTGLMLMRPLIKPSAHTKILSML